MARIQHESRINRLAYFIDRAKSGRKVTVEVVPRKQFVEWPAHPDETDDMTGITRTYLLLADFICECDDDVATISKIYVYGFASEPVEARRVNASVANERLKMDYQRLKDASIMFEEKYF
jgi:hypothetical protein